MDPAAEYTQHLLINMYALDGPPRIVHIGLLAQRQELRARHYALGLQQIARELDNLRTRSLFADSLRQIYGFGCHARPRRCPNTAVQNLIL